MNPSSSSSDSGQRIVGEEKGKDTTTTLLETASSATQPFRPLKAIGEYLCGFHFYSHDMSRQVEAHHYCSHMTEDFRQCLIYDSGEADARLIGVEYIISETIFDGLPADEKKYWHSHNYEIHSGLLVMPFNSVVPWPVADAAEKKALSTLIRTYGKTWHFWQVDRGDTLPLGPPQLMYSFTADGQIDESKLKERDARLGMSYEVKKGQRMDLEFYKPHEGADFFESGRTLMCEMKEKEFVRP
jgi:hypothetical protein